MSLSTFKIAIEIRIVSEDEIAVQELHPDGQACDFYGEYLDKGWLRVLANILATFKPTHRFPLSYPSIGPSRSITSIIEKTRSDWERLRPKITPLVFREYGEICRHCGTEEGIVIDHIIPISKGGTNHLDNLQPMCSSCNSKKGASYE